MAKMIASYMKKMTNYYLIVGIPWIQGKKDVKNLKWARNVFPQGQMSGPSPANVTCAQSSTETIEDLKQVQSQQQKHQNEF